MDNENTMDNENIMVSICCFVYNHEKYLRKCLEGFMMQKTNFKFEVLIHDDASTDSSADIIREYEKKYSDIIKPIYQSENQYSKGVRIDCTFLYPRVKGKYIALCEGDDYWCDENKLQKQFGAMENNCGCSICVTKVTEVLENGVRTGDTFPQYNKKNGIIEKCTFIERQLVGGMHRFHTSSFFIRKSCIDLLMKNRPFFWEVAPVGDAPLLLFCGTVGDAYYINEECSCYRRFAIGSWTETIRKKNYETIIQGLTRMYREFGKFTLGEYQNIVDYAVALNEFHLLEYKSDYAGMQEKQYKVILKTLPLKQRLYYKMHIKFPQILNHYKTVKSWIRRG